MIKRGSVTRRVLQAWSFWFGVRGFGPRSFGLKGLWRRLRAAWCWRDAKTWSFQGLVSLTRFGSGLTYPLPFDGIRATG